MFCKISGAVPAQAPTVNKQPASDVTAMLEKSPPVEVIEVKREETPEIHITSEEETPEAKEIRSLVDEHIPVPSVNPHFYISPEDLLRLKRIRQLSSKGEIVNCMLRGPKGSGKTSMARQYAALNKCPFHEVSCGAIVEPDQWFGKDKLAKGETFYMKGKLVLTLETEGSVLLLDETNRPHPEVLNSLFGILDWRRTMWSDDLGREIRVAKGVVIFGTINEGDGYIVNPMDEALRERFSRAIEVKYPPKNETVKILVAETGVSREIAGKLAELREYVRRKPELRVTMSVRQLLVAAQEVTLGADLREAVMISLVNHLSDMQQKQAVLGVLQNLGENVSDIMHEIQDI
jgi:nitric oxide reductase NorQ protein